MQRWPWLISIAATLSVACSPAPAPTPSDASADVLAPSDSATEGDSASVMDSATICPSSFAEMQQRWFGPRCATAGCHSATMPSLNLDLSTAMAEQRMIGSPSLGCPPARLIVAGDPSASQFYVKLAEASPSCGARMPIGGAAFTQDELACVRAWISAITPSTMDAGADATPGADASAEASVDSSVLCAAGQSNCGGTCVDTRSNASHCGGCGRACAAGQSCVAGACTTSCAAGQMLCSGACVDTTTSSANCGGCGRACAAGQSCVAGACVACSPVSFAGAVQPIFTANCTTGCHGGVRPAAGLSLAAGASYAALVNVRSSCPDGRVYVRPSDTTASYLLNKLTGVGICSGSAMPISGGPLPAASITTIRNWICNGAPNN